MIPVPIKVLSMQDSPDLWHHTSDKCASAWQEPFHLLSKLTSSNTGATGHFQVMSPCLYGILAVVIHCTLVELNVYLLHFIGSVIYSDCEQGSVDCICLE